MALIVVVSLVDAKPIVPRYHHVRFPTQPAAEGVLGEVSGEVLQNGRTFLAGQPFDADSIRWIEVQGLLAGHRVCAHHRVRAAADLALKILRERRRIARGGEPADRAVAYFDRGVRGLEDITQGKMRAQARDD